MRDEVVLEKEVTREVPRRKHRIQVTNEGIDSDDEEEIAQENETYYSKKHAEDIISYYAREPDENPNSWGSEYYDNEMWDNQEAYNETLNENWGTPSLDDEVERHIDEVWRFWIVVWTYDREEVTDS